jgi:hypothetical protein
VADSLASNLLRVCLSHQAIEQWSKNVLFCMTPSCIHQILVSTLTVGKSQVRTQQKALLCFWLHRTLYLDSAWWFMLDAGRRRMFEITQAAQKTCKRK